MNETRRRILTYLAVHGNAFELDMCSPGTGKRLHALGLLERSSASGGRRPIVLAATEQGKAAVLGRVCDCGRCIRRREVAESNRLRYGDGA
jgi:hypothetical protein